jgi:NAD-specific glutamate dehydrogenase
MTPPELIKTMLQAPVDLLYNGGIGTYVKASSQSHQEANDRGNDILRVDASQLKARVIGEGGNLGLTQKGRIEFASMAAGFSPTRSTIRPASIAPTTRSISRSCWPA